MYGAPTGSSIVGAVVGTLHSPPGADRGDPAWPGHASAAFTMSVYAHNQDDALEVAASSFGRVVTTSSCDNAVPPVGLEPTLDGF